MFHWNKKIYMDEKVKEKPSYYRKIVTSHKLVRSCYCITLPANEENCMDIYNSREFWFRYYRKKNLEIIGLAANQEKAQILVGTMVQDVIEAFGECNSHTVKMFFS